MNVVNGHIYILAMALGIAITGVGAATTYYIICRANALLNRSEKLDVAAKESDK